jgi:hypothetical protein
MAHFSQNWVSFCHGQCTGTVHSTTQSDKIRNSATFLCSLVAVILGNINL